MPGLAAKPVIDIQISVARAAADGRLCGTARAARLLHLPHADDAFCPFFHRPADWPHTHHIHVVEAGGAEERRTLAFRDYLRSHADAAAEYTALKTQLARDFSGADAQSREAYAAAKSAFVERMVAAAGGLG